MADDAKPMYEKGRDLDPETGLFQKGKKGGPGRPHGSRPKLQAQFYDDLYGAWKEKGRAAIDEMIADKPGDFVRVVASQMPKQHELNEAVLDDLTDEQLGDIIATLRHFVDRSEPEACGDGSEASTRH